MNKNIKGSILLLTSAILYGFFGIVSRFTYRFPAFTQSWIRSVIILFFLSILFLAGKEKWKTIEKKDIKWLLIWIVPSSFQTVLTFLAFNHLQLGTAYYILYSTMILGGIFSGKIFFSEKFNLPKYLSLFFILLGLFLIYGSDFKLVGNIYVVMMLISGLLVGFWNTLSKKISGNYSESQLMILDSSVTLIVCFLGAKAARENLPSFSDLHLYFWILIFAVLNMVSIFILIRGFKYVQAQVGSLILPTEVFFASIFAFIIFHEVLLTRVYIGGLLIFLAAITLPFIDLIRNKNKK
ncbi:MAG TPA: DMT family transporter [Alphaproteobacteria bacterium]|jgi:drug/metabolite transporter (DMT)-like permease|nr:DMT family transporter [Alphaproteobacteria bacterium]